MIARKVLSKYARSKTDVSSDTAQQAAPATKNGASGLLPPSLLSPREHEVLNLIARGFSYAEIARLQAVSVHTVQTHIKNLYAKLSVHSKNEAVFEATRLGLLASHNF